jgi:phosphoribosyl 1,2-cyclic phosphodiesterase
MRITLWGTRGSLAVPEAKTARYGGDTSCVEVRGSDGTVLVLDAGTGIRQLNASLPKALKRIDVLLTHLHMDHIQGLGFFRPLYDPMREVHLWGPPSLTLDLRTRLRRYLSPPLFPVYLHELPCKLQLHEVPGADFEVGEFHVSSELVCHPGPTVGFRISSADGTLAYLPDHEPALGIDFPLSGNWTSGYSVAADVDVLIHDAQYTAEEYPEHVGWGHSSLQHALEFAALARVKHLVPFHHDPAHNDEDLDRLMAVAIAAAKPAFIVIPGTEGTTFELADGVVQVFPAEGGKAIQEYNNLTLKLVVPVMYRLNQS